MPQPTSPLRGPLWQQVLLLKKQIAELVSGVGGSSGITALTTDVVAGPGSGTQAATIANDAVTNAKAANMAQSTIKGRAVGAGTGDPTDLTATQATAILDNVVGDSGSGGNKGLVPAPSAGDAAAGKFLKADGTFAVPPGTYTDEHAQDAVGGILDDGGDIDFTYDDATPKITAAVKSDAVTYAKMQNVSAASRLLGRGSASGAGDPEEIALGSGLSMSGTTLSGTGGGYPFTFSGALARKSVDQTAADYTTATAVAWDSEDYDTDAYHDNVTNNTRMTVPSGVTYVRVYAELRLASVLAGNEVLIEIRKNGSATPAYGGQRAGTPLNNPTLSLASPPIPVTAGDYFEIFLLVQTDTSITVTADRSYMAMEKVA